MNHIKNVLVKLLKKLLFLCGLILASALLFFSGMVYQKHRTSDADTFTLDSIAFWEDFFTDNDNMTPQMQRRLDKLNALYE